MNNIKVFFNNSHLLITSEKPDDDLSYDKILDNDEEIFAFRIEPKELFDAVYRGNILIVTPHVEEVLESIFDFAKGVVAAGGIVRNERGQILIMFRRGFWDLPKGKVEKGEKIINAAQREVEEETGVQIESLSEQAVITYHCYNLKGKDCIKETHWYHMQARSGQEKLVPQTEEDIEEALWADQEAIKSIGDKFYPLIWGLLVRELGL